MLHSLFVAGKYPVYKIDDVYRFDKYATHSGSIFLGWIWFQMVVLLFVLSYLFANIAAIGSPGIFVYGAFIFLFVYSLTELMDGNPYAWLWELGKCLYGLSVLYYEQGWFGLPGIYSYVIAAYLAVSTGVSYTYKNHATQ